jgi:ATP-dependent RNA helicase DeaD
MAFDKMLDMGFREELEEILNATPEGRQTLFASTMPKPVIMALSAGCTAHLDVGEDRGHGDIRLSGGNGRSAPEHQCHWSACVLHEAETAILFCAHAKMCGTSGDGARS